MPISGLPGLKKRKRSRLTEGEKKRRKALDNRKQYERAKGKKMKRERALKQIEISASTVGFQASSKKDQIQEEKNKELADAAKKFGLILASKAIGFEHKLESHFNSDQANVVHADELIDKRSRVQVKRLLWYLNQNLVRVVYLQGATPLMGKELFLELLKLLRNKTVWSINLGELKFSAVQLEALEDALRDSFVTHMFYECTAAGLYKDSFRSIIRDNRTRHQMWKLSADPAANHRIRQSVKNWFNPCHHKCNKEWIENHPESGGTP